MFQPSLVINAANIVLATNSSTDFLWYFFIVFLVVSGIILGAILLVFSSKPNDWRHVPITGEFFGGGRLKYLGDSIKFVAQDSSSYSSLKNQIEALFFEKVRTAYGLAPEELTEMKMKNPKRFRRIILDDEIANWILDSKQKERFGFFKSDRDEKKKAYLSEINLILDKMEVWGK